MRRRKGFLWLSLILILLISATLANIPFSAGSPATATLSAPIIRNETLGVGSTFSVNITVDDVSRLLGYMFTLRYNTTVLTAESAVPWPGPPPVVFTPFYQPLPSRINDTAGFVELAALTYYGDPTGVATTEPIPVAKINFRVDVLGDSGESVLDLYDTMLTDVSGDLIDHDVVDGYFSNLAERHDVAVANVVANQSVVTSGRSISINVTVTNEGNVLETFNVSVYYQDLAIAPAQKVTNLIPKTYKTLEFLWDTTGVVEGSYTLKAEASVVLGEKLEDQADNIYIYVPKSDLAVIEVTASPTIVVQNNTVTIDVTIQNEGNVTETFNASVYYDTSLIETKTALILSASGTTTLSFSWNTSGVDFGTYTIKAEVHPVPGEKLEDQADNVKEDGQVNIASGLHDIYIEYVTTTPTPPGPIVVGKNVTIYVIVGNQGTYNENVTVAVYLNHTTTGTKITLESKNVTNLAPGNSTVPPVEFTWNTTGVDYGTYRIIANASVPEDINLENNVNEDVMLNIVEEVHDVAVTSVAATPSTVVLGGSITIIVGLKNDGNVAESFTLNVRYNGNPIDSRSVSLEAGATKNESFTWTPASIGSFTITAEVPAVTGETDTDDNVKTAAVIVAVRDIAVISVTASKAQAAIGESITIRVTVKNEGNHYDESFSVTTKYDDTDIGTISLTLPKGVSTTLSFPWSTTGVNPGTYTITANASVVSEESSEDQIDNIGTVAVTLKLGSTISMSVSSNTITVGESITVNGSVNPARVGVAVTIWQRLNGTQTWNNITLVQTNESGQYTFNWKPTTAGTYEIKASWEGDADTFRDESDLQIVTVKEAPPSSFLYALAGITVIIVMAAVIVYFMRIRKPKQK